MADDPFSGEPLTRISIDDEITFLIGNVGEVRLGATFELESQGERLRVDPAALSPSGLALLLGLLHRRVERAAFDEVGSMTLEFENGAALRCEPDDRYEAWSASSNEGWRLVALPGGGLARWTP